MTRESKAQAISDLKQILADNAIIYLADTSAMNAAQTSELRRECFKNNIQMQVVKNTLLQKAMEASDKDFEDLYGSLKGNTSMMVASEASAPAKLIKAFRKKNDKPILKGAYIEEACYVGDAQLDALVAIKSKEEIIGDIIGLLQSPAKNVLSALQSGGNTISGIVKTLSER